MMIKGYTVALLVLVLFASVAFHIRGLVPDFMHMNNVLYYWFCFTVLTGVWEFFYVLLYKPIAVYAEKLKATETHVWTTDYPLKAILPHNTATLFYAEYGAHADREYMSSTRGDFWSRLIESSHALCCGLLCLGTLLSIYHDKVSAATWLAGAGMGAQFMNSLLYMGQYFLECGNVDSPNYNCPAFPLGKFMMKRWFMWVNLAWLLFPAYIIYVSVHDNLTGLLLAPLALIHFTVRRYKSTTVLCKNGVNSGLRGFSLDQEFIDWIRQRLDDDELVIIERNREFRTLLDLSTETLLHRTSISQLYNTIFKKWNMRDPTDQRYILYQGDRELVNLLTTGSYSSQLEEQVEQIRNGTFRLSIFNIVRFLSHRTVLHQ